MFLYNKKKLRGFFFSVKSVCGKITMKNVHGPHMGVISVETRNKGKKDNSFFSFDVIGGMCVFGEIQSGNILYNV